MAAKLYKAGMIMIVFVSLMLFTGCQDKPDTHTFELDGKTYEFPKFVFEQYPNAPHAYAFATEARDVLKYIPCYCGCDVEPYNHQSNLNCFIDEEKSTEEIIVYDSHGAG
ncbi:hypothetical protein CathTA2_1612 [Caldalkalibacillus thermarum TA2.A1]|uniref:PCYCGC domain-containing protein n=2 Tax=Caldalkalibacillus TaxID=379065 RepID=F5L712_CALTT|nr:hypothetical protein CathTA2_1612 [Caldalkalibacillus thermarum TA2.A1]QZT32700.1 PCYCGC domain-containing protein [Caldalkalibacillus thermarum TA2.A1]